MFLERERLRLVVAPKRLCSCSQRCARIFFCSCALFVATAGAWNFGLCATRSREPRQARKGATVPGTPRVPQITRGSSHRTSIQLSVSVRGTQVRAKTFFFADAED